MKDILFEIAENKRKEVEALIQYQECLIDEKNLLDRPVFPFSQRLKEIPGGIIAEFKRRSPSKGEISPIADISRIIPEYVENGAAACSVLTDTRFFGGSPADLALAYTLAKETPLLRKDFIISKEQILQARVLGASAILLIATLLSASELTEFNTYAHSLGMEVLVEIHDIKELDKLSFSPDMLGVNNRNLSSFHTDIDHSFKLAESLPKETVLVAESGIKSPDDIIRLRGAGFTGFLVGEAFMSTSHPGKTLRKFVNEGR